MAIYDGMAVQPGDVRYGNIPFAVAGQIVDLYFHEIVSKQNIVENILFGAPVSWTALGTVINLVDGTSVANYFGIAVRELAREQDVRGVAGQTQYLAGNTAAIMRKGHIYVEMAADTVTQAKIGQEVFTDGGLFYGSTLGSGALALVALPGVTFESDALGGEIVEIRLA